jgi:hypothetical protein
MIGVSPFVHPTAKLLSRRGGEAFRKGVVCGMRRWLSGCLVQMSIFYASLRGSGA